jgi:anti-sigma factor RsiW
MEHADDLTCAQLVDLVTEYLEGSLARDRRAILEAHLLDCDGCVNYIDQMRTTIALTGRLREDDVPPEIEARLVRAFRGWRANSPG